MKQHTAGDDQHKGTAQPNDVPLLSRTDNNRTQTQIARDQNHQEVTSGGDDATVQQFLLAVMRRQAAIAAASASLEDPKETTSKEAAPEGDVVTPHPKMKTKDSVPFSGTWAAIPPSDSTEHHNGVSTTPNREEEEFTIPREEVDIHRWESWRPGDGEALVAETTIRTELGQTQTSTEHATVDDGRNHPPSSRSNDLLGVSFTKRQIQVVAGIVCLVLVVFILVVVVPLSVVAARNNNQNGSGALATSPKGSTPIPAPAYFPVPTLPTNVVPTATTAPPADVVPTISTTVVPTVTTASSITATRLDTFRSILLNNSVSSKDDLSNESSPQYQAMFWLAFTDQANLDPLSTPLVTILNRYILSVLYFANDGTNWITQPNFLSQRSICSWNKFGIGVTSCSPLKLELGSNSLKGTIVSELGFMTGLQELNLNGNSFTGTIPSQLGNLSLLTGISLDENSLRGTIPSQLGRMTQLTYLSLEYNNLTGTVPTFLSALSRLEVLLLNGNHLSGDLGPVFCNGRSLSSWTLFQADCSSSELLCSCCTVCY